MADIRSPLAAHARPGAHGAAASGGAAALTLSHDAPGALFQLAGWADFAEAAAPALSTLGFNGLGDYRSVQVSGPVSAYRIAPDKLLLRGEDHTALATALKPLDPARAATVDLSHARWVIALEGPALEEVLARLVTVDVATTALPAGSFVQTGIHGVPVLLHRIGEQQAELLIPTTFAATIWELTCEACAPFGYRVAG